MRYTNIDLVPEYEARSSCLNPREKSRLIIEAFKRLQIDAFLLDVHIVCRVQKNGRKEAKTFLEVLQ